MGKLSNTLLFGLSALVIGCNSVDRPFNSREISNTNNVEFRGVSNYISSKNNIFYDEGKKVIDELLKKCKDCEIINTSENYFNLSKNNGPTSYTFKITVSNKEGKSYGINLPLKSVIIQSSKESNSDKYRRFMYVNEINNKLDFTSLRGNTKTLNPNCIAIVNNKHTLFYSFSLMDSELSKLCNGAVKDIDKFKKVINYSD